MMAFFSCALATPSYSVRFILRSGGWLLTCVTSRLIEIIDGFDAYLKYLCSFKYYLGKERHELLTYIYIYERIKKHL